MSIELNDYIKFGECRTVHGIKGGFTFYLYNTKESHLRSGSEIVIVSKGIEKTYSIKSINFGNKVICYLNGIENRNHAESLIPFEIYYSKESLKNLNDDEFYLNDLKGFEVLDFDTEKPIGDIISFYESGESIIVVIRTASEKLELPFVDSFFPKKDFNKKRVYLKSFEVYSER
jgi:16S rRNA processing protein RimM